MSPSDKKALQHILTTSFGITALPPGDCLIGGHGLQSVDGIVLAVALEDKFGIKIDDRVNPLVSEARTARTMRELQAWLGEQLAQPKRGVA
ncbi:MAG: acyl carrier protein [Proteobacteria bacterium]|nr:acyl carrier protein [Pseudomonadota bacterium]